MLKPFPSADKADVDLLISNGVDATELLVKQGLVDAQNVVHAW